MWCKQEIQCDDEMQRFRHCLCDDVVSALRDDRTPTRSEKRVAVYICRTTDLHSKKLLPPLIGFSVILESCEYRYVVPVAYRTESGLLYS